MNPQAFMDVVRTEFLRYLKFDGNEKASEEKLNSTDNITALLALNDRTGIIRTYRPESPVSQLLCNVFRHTLCLARDAYKNGDMDDCVVEARPVDKGLEMTLMSPACKTAKLLLRLDEYGRYAASMNLDDGVQKVECSKRADILVASTVIWDYLNEN